MSLAFPVTFAGVKDRDIENVKTCLAKFLLWLNLIIHSLLDRAEFLSNSEEGHDHTRQCLLQTVILHLPLSQTFTLPFALIPPPADHLPASALPLMLLWKDAAIPSQNLPFLPLLHHYCLFSWIIPFGLKHALLLLSPLFKNSSLNYSNSLSAL